MFVENSSAAQRKMFTIEDELDERLKKQLQTHWSELFFKKVFLGIDEKIFALLYCPDNGRPNFPVNILVSLEILKELHNLTDEQLFERYRFDLSFRRAMGLLDFNEHILAERTLYNFRAAVAQYNREHGVDLMEPVFRMLRDEIIEELGIKTGVQRTDSTLISANIKKMSRMMLFHKVLSNLVKDMKERGIVILREIEDILGEDEDRFTYRLRREEYEGVLEKLAVYVYRLVAGHRGDKRLKDLASYQDAQRLLEEQCHITRKRKVVLKKPEEIQASSMQNPADADATYRKKGKEEHRGYTLHATETCDTENKVQVVMDVEVTKNVVDDAAVLAGRIEKLEEESGLMTMIADGSYASDEVRKVCMESSVELVTSAIRGKRTDTNENIFTSKDFICDERTGEILACPVGNKPRSTSVHGSTAIANFDPKVCARCSKRSLCPVRVTRTQARYVIDERRRWLDARQEKITTGEYQKLCALRPPIEGLMSQFKPKYLRGRVKFRGIVKVKSRMIMKAIGINFKRYWRYIVNIFCVFMRKLVQLHYFEISLAQR